jgi:hypothetical protein
MAQYTIGKKVTSITGLGEKPRLGIKIVSQPLPVIPVGGDGRVVRLGAWLWADDGSTDVRLGLYASNASQQPTALMAQTNKATHNSAEPGANFERDITLVNVGYGSSQKGAIVRAGDKVQIAISETDLVWTTYIEERASEFLQVYERSGVTAGELPNPFSHTSSGSISGYQTWYAIIEQNRAPVISNMVPAGGVISADTTPDFSFRVTDPDRTAGFNDYPTQAIIRVYEVIGGSGYVLVGTQVVNLTKPADGTGAIDVGPITWNQAALTLGNTYAWTVEVKDEIGGVTGTGFGGRNAVTGLPDGSTTFVLTTNGTAIPTAPTGKLTTIQPANFVALYDHPNNFALDKVRLRLMKLGSSGIYTLLETTALLDIANVAADNPVTIPWATTGFDDLEWGVDYRVDWELTSTLPDTSDWILGTTFHTNYIPQKPTGLNPSGGEVVLSLPMVQAVVVDDDDEPNPPGDLTAEFEITGPYPLANPSFDTNLAGWAYAESSASFTETYTRDTTAPHSGAGNARIVQAAAPASTTATFELEGVQQPCYEGSPYQLNAWVKRSAADVVPLLGIKWYAANGTTVLSTTMGTDLAPTVATWTLATLTAEAPVGARFMAPILQGHNASTTPTVPYTLEWDDISFADGVRYVRTGSHAGSNVFIYQTTVDDVPDYDTYTIRARGRDDNNTGPWSDPESFIYTLGPSAHLTAPADASTILSSQPTFQWVLDSGTQALYRVRIINANDLADEIFDSGWIASTSDRAYTVPTGYLGNSASYIGQLWIDSGLVSGVVDTASFTVTFVAPPVPGNVQAVPVTVGDESAPTAVLISWDAVSTSPENLESIEIWMRDSRDDKRIARFTDPGATAFLYHYPREGEIVEYRVRQRVRSGSNVTDGLFGTAETQINLDRISLISVNNPYGERLYLQAWSSQRINLLQEQNWQVPAGGTDYVEIPGLLRGREIVVSLQFFDAQDGSGRTAEDDLEMLYTMFDGRDILCLRDARRGKWFGRISGNPSVAYGKGGVRATADITLRRVAFDEGA